MNVRHEGCHFIASVGSIGLRKGERCRFGQPGVPCSLHSEAGCQTINLELLATFLRIIQTACGEAMTNGAISRRCSRKLGEQDLGSRVSHITSGMQKALSAPQHRTRSRRPTF